MLFLLVVQHERNALVVLAPKNDTGSDVTTGSDSPGSPPPTEAPTLIGESLPVVTSLPASFLGDKSWVRGRGGRGRDLAKVEGRGKAWVGWVVGGVRSVYGAGGEAPDSVPERSLWRQVGRIIHTIRDKRQERRGRLENRSNFLGVLPRRQSLHPHTTLLLDHYLYRGETSSVF